MFEILEIVNPVKSIRIENFIIMYEKITSSFDILGNCAILFLLMFSTFSFFTLEMKSQTELVVASMEGAELAQSYVLLKIFC